MELFIKTSFLNTGSTVNNLDPEPLPSIEAPRELISDKRGNAPHKVDLVIKACSS